MPSSKKVAPEVIEAKRPRGRPPGSGKQLPAGERTRLSRAARAESAREGGIRLDFWLTGDSAAQLNWFIEQWDNPPKKHAIERILAALYQTIHSTTSK